MLMPWQNMVSTRTKWINVIIGTSFETLICSWRTLSVPRYLHLDLGKHKLRNVVLFVYVLTP